MPIPVANPFTSYTFTPDEFRSGSTLTTLQKMVIQTQIAQTAEEKLAVVFDPKDTQSSGLQMSYLAGKLDSLTFLLASSDEAEAEALTLARQSKE